MLTCAHCSSPFDRVHFRGPAPRYCSASCRQAAHRERNRPEVPTDEWDDPARWPDGVPDGWVLIHHRAVGASCYFGPFPTHAASVEWMTATGAYHHVNPFPMPMWLDVKWNRG